MTVKLFEKTKLVDPSVPPEKRDWLVILNHSSLFLSLWIIFVSIAQRQVFGKEQSSGELWKLYWIILHFFFPSESSVPLPSAKFSTMAAASLTRSNTAWGQTLDSRDYETSWHPFDTARQLLMLVNHLLDCIWRQIYHLLRFHAWDDRLIVWRTTGKKQPGVGYMGFPRWVLNLTGKRPYIGTRGILVVS